jgi:pyrroloquinoline quinone biosynthesis protein E
MWALNPEIIIRPEPDGALGFNPNNAETVYLDGRGLNSIDKLLRGNSVEKEFPLSFLSFLVEKSFLIKCAKPSHPSIETVRALIESRVPPVRNSLSVPETLHIALTNTCDQTCSGCFYSRGQAEAEVFLKKDLFEAILESARRHRIFQFAFGGGEPLLHPFILEFVEKSRKNNIVPNITTNGNLITKDISRRLKSLGLGQIQISLDAADERLNSETRPNFAGAMKAIDNCRKSGLRFGINTLVTRNNFRALPGLIQMAEEIKANGINLLRPKPPVLSSGWLQEVSLSPDENLEFHQILRKATAMNAVDITLDQSLSFLAFHRKPEELYRNGVWGCGAGRRFLTIDPSGDIFPCSHYRKVIGTDGDFITAWKGATMLEKFRNLENNVKGHCCGCHMLRVCRGCRAVVVELDGGFFDSDPHCPLGSPNPAQSS